MNLGLKIAWRNLWRHKGKSIVIGVILFIGSLLMTVGNGLVTGMKKGMYENIVNSFTGDIVLLSSAEEKDDVLFSTSGKPLKVLKEYGAIREALEEEQLIDKFVPITAGMVYVLNQSSEMGYVSLLGVDIDEYRLMFPNNFEVVEGREFKPGEKGLLISEELRKQAWDMMDFWTCPEGVALDERKLPSDARDMKSALEVRNDFVFMGVSTSNSTADIRVPVTGIMKYSALSKVWGNFGIVDIDSFREAHSYVTSTDAEVEISKDKKDLLESESLDDLFSAEGMVEEVAVLDSDFSVESIQKQTQKTETPSTAGVKGRTNPGSGSYNLVFAKLREGVGLETAINRLNATFKRDGIGVRAVSWASAIGIYGSMATLIKVALNVFIMLIFFVAIVVIMNTLSMAAMERVSEIGMMRAIGARKGFVREMFIYETGLLSFFFGGLGMVVGVLVIYLLRSAGITTTDEILQLVYGGDVLNPSFALGDFILGVAELSVVTVLAVLYPLSLVGKIAPLDAITRD